MKNSVDRTAQLTKSVKELLSDLDISLAKSVHVKATYKEVTLQDGEVDYGYLVPDIDIKINKQKTPIDCRYYSDDYASCSVNVNGGYCVLMWNDEDKCKLLTKI
jgi:hypothetical protein